MGFAERRLPPQTSRRRPIRETTEVITYVREGTLAYEDSTGRAGLILAGEFQRMTAGHGIRYGETNASPTMPAHVFQLWLRPAMEGLRPGHEQRRFTVAERRGVMCVIASPDGRNGSLLVHQDALLFSTILGRGQHLIHELSDGRCAWLHVVQGMARCGAVTMSTGDGAGLAGEQAVSLTATVETELLVLELDAIAVTGNTDVKHEMSESRTPSALPGKRGAVPPRWVAPPSRWPVSSHHSDGVPHHRD